MIKQKDHFHGSDLEKIEQIYGIRKEELISFSANVNPLGISPLLREALIQKLDTITAYPDREYTSLRQSIAAYCGTTAEHVLVGSGATELISLFIQLARPKKALVLGPTYSEYEREIALGGGQTLYYPLSEKRRFRLEINDFLSQLDETLELLVICNPNNPTSSSVERTDMTRILDVCLARNIHVMIDETYIEFAADMEQAFLRSSDGRLPESYRPTRHLKVLCSSRTSSRICHSRKSASDRRDQCKEKSVDDPFPCRGGRRNNVSGCRLYQKNKGADRF